VIISSEAYQKQRLDVILLAITSRFKVASTVGELEVRHWQNAGLIKPSVFKPLLATLEKRLIIQTMGKLHEEDRVALRQVIDDIIGR